MSGSDSSAAEPPLVALLRVTKRYGERTVLQIEQFELRRGDTVLIAGENGSGKSTLLRILAGVSVPTSGEVRRAPEFDTLDIAFVPQAGGLQPNLSVAENLRQSVRLRGRPVADQLKQRWYVEGLGLEPHLSTRFRDLSGGFQRLATLSCALAAEPDVLFIDEPLSGVDARHAELVVTGLRAAQCQLELLVATGHSMVDFSLANRVLELRGEVPA